MAPAAPRRFDATVWALMLIGALATVVAATLYAQSRPPTTIFVLGPAESSIAEGSNPGLTTAGHARAVELVRVIGQQPANNPVAAVFATRYRASQETAQPVARHLDLPVQIIDSADPAAIVQRIESEFSGRSLIVFTDPAEKRPLLNALLGQEQGAGQFAEDGMYIVTRPRFGAATAVALRYGAPVNGATES